MTDTNKAVALAQKEEQALSRKLTFAAEALATIEASYLASGSDQDLDAVQRARLKAERARTLHETAVAALATANAAHTAAEMSKAREQHANDLLNLPHWPESLALLHDELIAIDRKAFDLLVAYDQQVEAGQREWDRALHTAVQVNSHLGAIPRPSLDDALLAAEIEASRAREADQRTPVADMFDPPAGYGDWRQDGLSADQRAQYAATVAATERADKYPVNPLPPLAQPCDSV